MEESDFLSMLEAQGGVCAICHANPATHTDHNHSTGQVRGLLCVPCNNGLGLFKDNPDRLLAAAAYLLGSRVRLVA